MIKPPGSCDHTRLLLNTLPCNTSLFRITSPDYPSPLFFNKSQDGRYNAPDESYGVCYMAETVEGAFAESIGHSVASKYNPGAVKIIEESALASVNVYHINIKQDLLIGDLTGTGLPNLNLDNQINALPPPYAIPQQWSQWVYEHPSQPDALRFHSRHLPTSLNLALYDRAKNIVECHDDGPLITWSDGQKDIWDILLEQGWTIY